VTPTSPWPLDKVWKGGIGAATAVIVLSLLKRYVMPDMTPDFELAVNILVVALVGGLSSIVAGYFTSIKPGEITYKDVSRIAEDARP
jgi:branched-subunit amino acid ABC-type transport system permease component